MGSVDSNGLNLDDSCALLSCLLLCEQDPPYVSNGYARVETRDCTPEAGAAAECVPNFRRTWKTLLNLSRTKEGVQNLTYQLKQEAAYNMNMNLNHHVYTLCHILGNWCWRRFLHKYFFSAYIGKGLAPLVEQDLGFSRIVTTTGENCRTEFRMVSGDGWSGFILQHYRISFSQWFLV